MKLTLIFSVFFSSLAFGAEVRVGYYCKPIQEIFPAVNYCYQNEYYALSSAACLQKFHQDVNSTRSSLVKSFQGNDGLSVSAQNSKLTNQEKNLTQTDNGLKGLLARARQAKQELELYQRNMIYPGRPSREFVQAYDLDSHLSTFSCFRDHYETVGRHIAEFNQKIAELERTDGKTTALNMDTSGDNKNLQQIKQSPGSVKATNAKGPNVPVGQSPRKQSTITGEVKKPALK